MNKYISIIAVSILFGATFFSACKQTDNPQPDEQELITTARLTLTNGGVSRTFVYRIENGFGSGSPGLIVIDTIRATPNTVYTTSVEILNEKANPVKDLTPEIVDEQAEHLFLYNSIPVSGSGSLTFSNGNMDANGAPFNLTGTLTSGPAGSGTLTLLLIHAPTDKGGTTPAASGGVTDVLAGFPVQIQ